MLEQFEENHPRMFAIAEVVALTVIGSLGALAY